MLVAFIEGLAAFIVITAILWGGVLVTVDVLMRLVRRHKKRGW